MKKKTRTMLYHIFNLLVAVAFAMAFLFPVCIFLIPVAIAALYSFAILLAINSNLLFSLRTVCKIE